MEKRGFALPPDYRYYPLFYFPFAESRKLNLKWLFIACFKRELGFAGRGQLLLFLPGIIIFMAQAEGSGAYQTRFGGGSPLKYKKKKKPNNFRHSP